MKIKQFFVTAVALAVSAAAVPAFALEGEAGATIPGIDTASLVSMITSLGAMVGAIGMAALSVVMGIRAIGYIKSALGK